jgi:hypothetical protein
MICRAVTRSLGWSFGACVPAASRLADGRVEARRRHTRGVQSSLPRLKSDDRSLCRAERSHISARRLITRRSHAVHLLRVGQDLRHVIATHRVKQSLCLGGIGQHDALVADATCAG